LRSADPAARISFRGSSAIGAPVRFGGRFLK